MSATTLEKNVLDVLFERRATKQYDPEVEISREELNELLEAMGQAPSAWNLQHWKFLAFHNPESQERLLPIAYNQQQITDASAVIAVLGDLRANENVDAVFDPAVEKGAMSEEIKQALNGQIQGAYENEQFARDAAFSNASLAAMQFMIAAKAKGWDTCPIGGFSDAQLIEEFEISDRYVPVMLITVGKAAKEARKSERIDIDELVEYL
ncbi:nitroreductase family protein [Jeotgalibacillus haloalkalitolerans]|uniref:Nitroreductase family protein n=1 Tax=Jeotgalibacillus haloalkalitolerans TaxID=3104292 RepID=A0ABU5KQ92_9BACL|nr:nitroreductase family protein [Jeotgalibacillus sp. HH7-29]MDZ5713126.1 nitroreductase family protein [Jeotgalibacillus sp. HH7-29]